MVYSRIRNKLVLDQENEETFIEFRGNSDKTTSWSSEREMMASPSRIIGPILSLDLRLGFD